MTSYQYFTSDRINLSYLEWGQSGEPVLLLHGLGDTALVWSSLGETVASEFHAIAPDMRGHGNSDKPGNGYDFLTLIGDLEILMDARGWDTAHIVGHSWTGKLVMVWMRHHPERFRSAVLVDPFFGGRFPSIFKFTFPLLYKVLPFLKMMGPFASFEQAEAVAKSLKQYRGWSELQQLAFEGSIEQNADSSWSGKLATAARDRIFDEVLTVSALTEEIDIPTTFVQPHNGLNRTELQLKPYRKFLKHLTIQSVPGNHWAFLVEPESFNQVLLNRLRGG
ncbi:MAG: alpha/beta hydrolase [Cyanobacteria bacterium P01_A01_bin.3]